MKTYRGGLPLGRSGTMVLGILWASMIIPLRLGIVNPVTLTLFMLALLPLPLAFIRSRIDVAADGVFLRWLFFSRFVPFGDIENVWYEPGQRAGFFRRADNARLILYGANRPLLTVSSRAGATDLQQAANAIEAGMVTYRASVPRTPFDSARLARAGATSTDWLSRIRALARMPASFREAAPPSHDELARILGDPHANEEQRAAAAVALAALGDDGKTHLRVAREATADPKLRVAIDAAISDDDGAMADALDKVAAAERERAS